LLIWIVAFGSFTALNPRAQTGPNLSGEWTLSSETITGPKGGADYQRVFRLGSHLSIQQDKGTFTVAIWTLPIDGDLVSDETGGRWRAVRQANGIVVTEVHGNAAAGTNSSHSMSFRLMADGRLSVEITADPVLEVSTVKSVYARSAKGAVPLTRPDFAGRWTVDEAASQLNGSTGWFSNDVTVSLDAKGLTVASVASGPGTGKSFFPTGGSQSRAGIRRHELSRAEWRGTQLVATTIRYSAETDYRTKREILTATEWSATISLGTDGALVVEVSFVAAPPRSGFATRSVYRRSKS
jgi:hypothetical protein